jgi:hypothetical protein
LDEHFLVLRCVVQAVPTAPQLALIYCITWRIPLEVQGPS